MAEKTIFYTKKKCTNRGSSALHGIIIPFQENSNNNNEKRRVKLLVICFAFNG